MNRFNKCISHRTSWCQIKRLQFSLSSNCKFQIPAKIKRNPTDILHALERTIPNGSEQFNYAYHNDPFLFPLKKIDYRNYALSYEAGKKAAMWIHNEHRDLFPKHLSEPEIQAFKPVVTYTEKSQVSEQVLLQTIFQCRISDALRIYNLLETNVSNETKQALLELLCFHTDDEDKISNNFFFERWYDTANNKSFWRKSSEINELYQFLITQDSLIAAAAHNVMICGLTRYLRIDEAWSLYKYCEEKDIPLNTTTYNCVLLLVSTVFQKNDVKKVEIVFDILRSMKKEGVKPNIRTLNAALKAIVVLPIEISENPVNNLVTEFKRINIKFSLATYYYIMCMFKLQDKASLDNFISILNLIKNESFTIQDPADNKFFTAAMYLAYNYSDKKAGDMIHNFLLTGNNHKFIYNDVMESKYYTLYTVLTLSTSTIDAFFEFYEKIVPNIWVPKKQIFYKILNELQYHTPETVAKYVAKLWSDVNVFCPTNIPLQLNIIRLMKLDVLPHDSPLNTVFVNAALNCWNNIEMEIKEKTERYNPVETAIIGPIVIILLRGGCLSESIKVLKYIVQQPDFFIPTMTKEQADELFETYISEKCIAGAFLALEYFINSGFQHTVEMVTKLSNLPQFTNNDLNKLIDLVGMEALNISDTSKSS